MGALETKKQFILSGLSLDRHEIAALKNCNYALDMDHSMSTPEETRVLYEVGAAEGLGHKT